MLEAAEWWTIDGWINGRAGLGQLGRHRISVDTRGVNVSAGELSQDHDTAGGGGIKTEGVTGSGAGTRVLVVDGQAVAHNGRVAGAGLG